MSRCRIVSSGDGAVTCVADTVQVVVLVLSCRKFNEPFFQIGVGSSLVVSRPSYVYLPSATSTRVLFSPSGVQVLPSLVTSALSVWLAVVQLGSAWLCESSHPALFLSVNTVQPDSCDSIQVSDRQSGGRTMSVGQGQVEIAECYVEMREDGASDDGSTVARVRSSR